MAGLRVTKGLPSDAAALPVITEPSEGDSGLTVTKLALRWQAGPSGGEAGLPAANRD